MMTTPFEKLVRYELKKCGLKTEQDVQDYLYVLENSVECDLESDELRDFNEIRKAIAITAKQYAHMIAMDKMKKDKKWRLL